MARLLRIARRYWIVTLTIVIGLFGLVFAVSGAGAAVPWIFSAYALAVAVWQAVGMVRDILHGHWGLDILAVTAIVATVLVGEYVAALLVVLMLTGGEALEDYANRRAKRELDALLTRAPQLAHRGKLDGNQELIDFSLTLEDVVIKTVESGAMTKDLAALVGPEQAYQTTEEFLQTLSDNLKARLA